MKKFLALWMAVLLSLWTPTAVWAQSGGNCSVFRSWITGDSLTAGDLSSSFTTVGVTNMTQACIDGISDTVAGMQTTTDPYASETESLATSGAGEIQRLRFVIGRIFGFTQWYIHTQNVNFGGIGVTKTNVQGSGFGQHVTAVGYHAWAGSARFPVVSTVSFHTTGLWFPRAGSQSRWTVAHHLAVSVGSGIDRDGTGIEVARFHLEAFQLHHTVALRFAHSSAGQAAWQYPHITALQVRRPQPGPDGTLPNMPDISDQIIVGHRSVALQLQGASLTPSSNRLVGYGPSADYIEAKTISGSLTITHQAGQIIFGSSAGAGLWASRGQFSGTGGAADAGHVFTLRAHVVQLMRASDHVLTVVANPSAINVDISDNISSANGATNEASPNGRDRKATLDASTWIQFYWIYHSGSSLLRGIASPNEPTVGPNLPQGFASWSYAGAVRRGSVEASPLVPVHILAYTAYYHTAQRVVTNSTATSETTVDVSSQVPPNAASYQAYYRWGTGGTTFYIRIQPGFNGQNNFILMDPSNDRDASTFTIPNISQRMFFAQGSGVRVDIDVLSYNLPNGGT